MADYLEMKMWEEGDTIAIIEDEEEITYKELNRRSNAFSNWLKDVDIKSEERVAVFLPNVKQYFPPLFGTWRIGAITLPINYRLSKEEIKYILRDSEARILITLAINLDLAKDLKAEIETLEKVVISGDVTRSEDFISLEEICRSYAGEFDAFQTVDGDDAVLMYTSGTTGKPKGVRMTHRNICAEADAVIYTYQITSKDCLMNICPMFHVTGLTCSSLPALKAGGRQIMMPRWEPNTFLENVQKWKATWSLLVGTMMVDLINLDVQSFNVSSLRFCGVGGSPIPPAIYDRFEEKYGVKMLELYGQTENSGLSVTYSVKERRRPLSMGKALERVVKMKIVDFEGKEVKTGEIGELMLKGDIITPGYLNLPEVNKKKFEDGWIHTGDMVKMDKAGYLYFAERTDDLIITGGENVYPREVEEIIFQHSAVAEVAVIGLPHERWGEEITAVIVPKKEIAKEEIIQFCKNSGKIAGYKCPRRIEFVDELPKTASRKISKAKLRKKFIPQS